jgi:hypothetical protein
MEDARRRVCLGEWLMLVVTSHPIDAAFHGSHELSTKKELSCCVFCKILQVVLTLPELNVEANSYQTQ